MTYLSFAHQFLDKNGRNVQKDSHGKLVANSFCNQTKLASQLQGTCAHSKELMSINMMTGKLAFDVLDVTFCTAIRDTTNQWTTVY